MPLIGAIVSAYGQALICVSESSGISWMNLDSDTGFALLREAYSPVTS